MLKILDLGNNNIQKIVFNELALVIKSNKYLEKLWLHNNNLKSSAIAILQSLNTISTLKLLNMENNQICDVASEALASVILHNRGLEELYLSGNHLGEGLLNVTKALQYVTSLRMLSMGNSNISKEVSGKLALAIESNKKLQGVWLHNSNAQSSAIAVLQSLSTISTLRFLNLNDNQIPEEAGEALASVILHNTGLEELHLSDNNLSKGILKVLKALQHITSLKTLNLEKVGITKEASSELALAITSNKNLKMLLVSHNNLRSLLIVILRALLSTSKLRSLSFFSNVITEEAGDLLAYVISRNTNLQDLSLNLLAAPLKVTEALQNLSVLQSLTFDTCYLSEEAESKIASMIANNKSLTWLSLENINLSQNVIRSIMTISNLTSLTLGDSLLSEEICDDLTLAISSNTSMEKLILLDNMLQTGLIKIAKACNKLSNIQVLQLAHNCIIPSKVVELTSIITQNTSLERVLLGGITLNAAEAFHYNINEALLKSSCVVSFSDCAYLEVIYLEMLRKQIDNDKKCFDNFPIYLNAKILALLKRFIITSKITGLLK